jgi:DNA-binding winged helix-turn-helix (wHTH) protein
LREYIEYLKKIVDTEKREVFDEKKKVHIWEKRSRILRILVEKR